MTFKAIKSKLFADIDEAPEALRASYFPSIDGLRGVAILCVVFSHSLLDNGISYYCYALGMIGVQTFFVISGFLITTLLLKEKISKGSISLKKFYIRRFLRIVPVAYLYLFIIALLAIILKLDIDKKSFFSAVLYIKNLVYLQGHDRFIGHFWTLSVEEQFYLIFPVLLVISPNKYLFAVVALILIIPFSEFLIYNKIGVFYSNPIIHNITVVIVDFFANGTISILFGSLLSILIFKKIILIKNIKSNYWLSLIIFFIAIILRTIFVNMVDNLDIGIILFSFGMAYILLLNLHGKNMFSDILNHPILIKIGVLSYSIYIWQALFTHNMIWKDWFKYSDSIWVNLPLLFLVSYVSYHYYEKWFLRLKDKFH